MIFIKNESNALLGAKMFDLALLIKSVYVFFALKGFF